MSIEFSGQWQPDNGCINPLSQRERTVGEGLRPEKEYVEVIMQDKIKLYLEYVAAVSA